MRRPVLFAATFCISLFFFFSLKYILSVKEIYISGTYHLEDIHTYDNAFLPTLNVNHIHRDLYQTNPSVKIRYVYKQYPNKLHIEVEESRPIMYIPVEGGYFTLNDAHRLVAKTLTEEELLKTNLVKSTYYQRFSMDEFRIGDNLGKSDINVVIDFLLYSKKLDLKIQTVDITGPHMIVLNSAERRYIMGVDDNVGIVFQQL